MMIEAKFDKGFLFREEVTAGVSAPSLQLADYPDDTEFLGISLGHAEHDLHEKGKSALIRLFHPAGMNAAKKPPTAGIADRLLHTPTGIQFIEGAIPSSDSDFDRNLAGQPVAILAYMPHTYEGITSSTLSATVTKSRLNALQIKFSDTRAGRFVSRWGTLGFRVAVVGAENVRLLKLFFSALSSESHVAVGLSTRLSLDIGSSPTLMVAANMPAEWHVACRERDQGARPPTHPARQGFSGGKLSWHKLRPALVHDEVMFWLEPLTPERTHTGYVSPLALQRWAEGTGPLSLRNTRHFEDTVAHEHASRIDCLLQGKGITSASSIWVQPQEGATHHMLYVFPTKLGKELGLMECFYSLEVLDGFLVEAISVAEA